jgi:hypothetical protein
MTPIPVRRRALVAVAAVVLAAPLPALASAAGGSSQRAALPALPAGLHWPTVSQLCRPRAGLPTAGVEFCDLRVNGPATAAPPVSNSPDGEGYVPADIQSIYRIAKTKHADRVAVITANQVGDVESELATYRSTFKLPPCTTTNGCFHSYDVSDPSAEGTAADVALLALRADNTLETALDVEAVSAMCPECKIDLVNAMGNESTSTQAAEYYATHTLHDKILTFSYSGGEGSSTDAKATAAQDERDLPPGTVLFNSSGDTNGGGEATAPGSDPMIVSVGGTSVVKKGQTWVTSAWNGTMGTGTTTGCSKEFAKPAYQKGSDSGCTGRAETDVSALADSATGFATYVGSEGVGGWLEVGGTSLATPLVAAMTARLGLGAKVTPATFYTNRKYLLDVTTGNSLDSNGTCGGDANQVCVARKGWDGPTGNGTPRGRRAFTG